MSEQRSRSDYRTCPPGTLKHYLLHQYPAGLDFKTNVAGWHAQLHATETDTCGNYLHLDSSGRLAHTVAFEDELCGVPHVTFRKALERVDEMDPVAGKVLRWHQKRFKEERYRFAMDLGVTERHITNILTRSVAMLREQLPDDARYAVEKMERAANGTEEAA